MQDPLLRLHCIPLSMLGCVLSSMFLRRGDLPLTMEQIATPREITPVVRNDTKL